MRILFIHKNYPAQFGRLAEWLASSGWDVTFATARRDACSETIRIVYFKEHRSPGEKTHHYLKGTESAVIAGQGMARSAVALRKGGYVPDIVVAHSGWGVGLFVKDVWPETKYIQYAEWYYNYPYVDSTPYAAPTDPVEASAKARTRNAPFWLDFSAADATICPTHYQASQFPAKVAPSITVLNDGFDMQTHCPGPRDDRVLADYDVPPDAPLLTYIARGMEPTRGFPEVMKAVETLQRRRQDLHTIIVADDRIAYGPKIPGFSWKTHVLEKLDLDQARLHFTGLVPRRRMIDLLRAADAHLYLSAPFVLSWSFVEAMACGAPIVAARGAPVEEFMTHEESGLLVDPADTDAVADAVERMLDNKTWARQLGSAARCAVAPKYDGNATIFPATAAFFASVLESDRPQGSRGLQSRPNAGLAS